jgi:hypothetical protein
MPTLVTKKPIGLSPALATEEPNSVQIVNNIKPVLIFILLLPCMDEMAGYHTGVIDLMINPNR